VIKTRKESTTALRTAINNPPADLNAFEVVISKAVDNNAPNALVSQGRTLIKKIKVTRFTEQLLKALKDQHLENLKTVFNEITESGLSDLIDSRVIYRANRLITAARDFASILESDDLSERVPEIEEMVKAMKGP
jgi:hypothetical protein